MCDKKLGSCKLRVSCVKYSYIQAIVFSFVEQFPTIEHVSEDRKAFEVGEIFYLLFCWPVEAPWGG